MAARSTTKTAAKDAAPAEATPAAEAPAVEAPADDAPAPAEEAPVADAPVADEAPTEEAPTEEAPADEAPAAPADDVVAPTSAVLDAPAPPEEKTVEPEPPAISMVEAEAERIRNTVAAVVLRDPAGKRLSTDNLFVRHETGVMISNQRIIKHSTETIYERPVATLFLARGTVVSESVMQTVLDLVNAEPCCGQDCEACPLVSQ